MSDDLIEEIVPVREVTFRGGVNIDVGRRANGLKRTRATFPAGRLTLADGRASLWVRKFVGLPARLPSPIAMEPDSTCVVARRSWPPGITFRTPFAEHQFWTLRPKRIMGALQQHGFPVCL